jgi:hypothetical protein
MRLGNLDIACVTRRNFKSGVDVDGHASIFDSDAAVDVASVSGGVDVALRGWDEGGGEG